MRIEPRTLSIIKKYMLKKHTPILDFEFGSVWVPSRPQDAFDFVARFDAPDLRSELPWKKLAVCPDLIQSEIHYEVVEGASFLSGANGAHYRVGKTELCCGGESAAKLTWSLASRALCCVDESESNRAHALVSLAKAGGLMPILEDITDGQKRAAESIAARFKKASGLSEAELKRGWYKHNRQLQFHLWKRGGNPGYMSLTIWL